LEGILISYQLVPRDVGFDAKFEVLNIIESVARDFPILRSAQVKLRPAGFKGLILVDFRPITYRLSQTEIDLLREKITKTYEKMRQEGAIRYISKFIILDALVETDIEKIADAVKKLSDKVKGKWRITLKTRKYPIDRMLLIKKAAEHIDLPVDLKNPEYIVLIEIIGGLTGIAILKKGGEIKPC